MKNEILVPIVILKVKNCYNAFSPWIEGCVVTERTIDSALKKIKEALEFHIEGEQLLKQTKRQSVERRLNKAFHDYGTDAFYASLKVSA